MLYLYVYQFMYISIFCLYIWMWTYMLYKHVYTCVNIKISRMFEQHVLHLHIHIYSAPGGFESHSWWTHSINSSVLEYKWKTQPLNSYKPVCKFYMRHTRLIIKRNTAVPRSGAKHIRHLSSVISPGCIIDVGNSALHRN